MSSEENIRNPMNRVLVISTTGMGDSLWGTPALRALKKSFPQLELHLLVHSHWKILFQGNPHIDKIIDYSPKWYKQPLIGLQLLSYHYDKVLIFHANKDIVRLLPWLRYSSLLAHQNSAWIADKNRIHIEGVVHGIQRRLTLIETIGATADGGQMELFFSPAERNTAETFMRENSLPAKNFIYINIGASAAPRRWPEDRFLQLTQTILKNTQLKILLGGGPGERKAILEMIKSLASERMVTTIDLPLKPDSYVIGQAKLLITCDTGPMHVGFALKTPTLSLFGPYDPRGTGPFELAKNHCFMLHPSEQNTLSKRDDYQKADLKQITVSTVWNKVQEALSLPLGQEMR